MVAKTGRGFDERGEASVIPEQPIHGFEHDGIDPLVITVRRNGGRLWDFRLQASQNALPGLCPPEAGMGTRRATSHSHPHHVGPRRRYHAHHRRHAAAARGQPLATSQYGAGCRREAPTPGSQPTSGSLR